MGNQLQNKLKLTMKTFATLALLGLAQAIRIKEDPAPAQSEAERWGHCGSVREVLDELAKDATYDWAAAAAAKGAPDDISEQMLNDMRDECDAWDACDGSDD